MASINKSIYFIFLLCIVFIAGCSDSFEYDNEDVVAVVRGEEITIGDLRFLYPDDKVLDNIEGTIKATLVVQEAKKMNIDVSEEIDQSILAMGGYPSEDIDTPVADSIRKFAKPQAKKFDMEPEEYYEEYIKKTTEIGAYVNQYIFEMLGEPGTEGDIEEYDEWANHFLDELVELNADDIQVLIKP